ncbi:MAG: hypothetical protein ACRETH_08645 [Steroidobacteraceae bacterium]
MEDPASLVADDPSVRRAERRLRLLEELAEIGMELARALRPGEAADGAAEAAAGGGKLGEPADAFARVSRAIRLTLALESKTDEALRDRKTGITCRREAERVQVAANDRKARAEAAAADRVARENQVRELVLRVAETEFENKGEFDDLYGALEERLEEDEAYVGCEDWPLRETIERLCKDLELTPDWSRWDGEGWIDDEPVRSRYSPFNRPSARPILIDGEWPPQAQSPPGSGERAHDLE